MTRPIVELQRHGDIAVIVVDNPPVNTITAEVRAGLFGALQYLRTDPTFTALILRCADVADMRSAIERGTFGAFRDSFHAGRA